MPLSTVTINVGSGGLGRRPLNNDRISGIAFYNNTLPSGFSTSLREIKVFSLAEAVALGIAKGSAAHGVEWYHISEFFRANPDGELWIGYYAVPGGAYAFTEVDTLQRAASGEIRQMGVYANALTYATAQVTTIQGVVNGLVTDGMPVSVFYAADMSGITAVTGWSTVGDLRALAARHVTVVASQDGGGAGDALFTSEGYSITTLGHTLGFISKAAVNQSIGNPENFNASNGVELETIALANGDLVSALTDTALGGIKDDGYQIAIKRTPKIAGTYYDRTPTATPAIDDFAWVEFSRTVDKAVRLTDSALTPKLLSGVVVQSDGTLSNDTIEYFRDVVIQALEGMKSDVEISNFEVLINPTQNVQSTSTLIVVVKIQPTAIAEFITVNIGLTNVI
jgi:hypothetical protein